MNEFPKPEQMSRQQRTNVERISTIVHALTDHIRHTNPSEHFTEPLQPTRSFQVDIPDTRQGFDVNGNFHRTVSSRWSDMGEYITDL